MEDQNKKLPVPRFYASVEEQEVARLKEALARSDEEKFKYLMNLIKLGFQLRKGTVTHKAS